MLLSFDEQHRSERMYYQYRFESCVVILIQIIYLKHRIFETLK